MKHAYLFYEEKDAATNKAFIAQLQQAATLHQIDLQLKIIEQFTTDDSEPIFVWNRTRSSAIATHYEARGIQTFNNAQTNRLANHKLLAQQFCQALGVPTVPSFSERPADLVFPFVMKSVDGHGGTDVFLCETEQHVAQASFQLQQPIYQPFIDANSSDVRLWMLGSIVLAAVKRTGQNSFKSNYTLGGTIERFAVPDTLAQYAQQITHALQSDYIGIDFLVGADGTFYFNELEDPVGARSYYDLYDKQLPVTLLNYVVDRLGNQL